MNQLLCVASLYWWWDFLRYISYQALNVRALKVKGLEFGGAEKVKFSFSKF